MKGLVSIITVALLSGCLVDAPLKTADAADGRPVSYNYLCPGGDDRAMDEVCVDTIQSAHEAIQEPYVALHPHDPDVIAILANEGQSRDAARLDAGAAFIEAIRLTLHFSEDSGSTWRRVPLPIMPGGETPAQLAISGDPAAEFDDDGVLHVTGFFMHDGHYLASDLATFRLGIAQNSMTNWVIFHIATPDLGRTWIEPTYFVEEGAHDRPWLDIDGDQIFVNYQNNYTIGYAWTTDGGVSWENRPMANPGSELQSNPVIREGNAIWVDEYARTTPSPGGTRVRSLDLATGEESVVFEDPGWSTARTLAASGSSLFLARSTDDGVIIVRSDDYGMTWNSLTDLRSSTSVDDPWSRIRVNWMAVDPFGNVHVLMAGTESSSSPSDATETGSEVAHVVLDGNDGAVLAQAIVSGVAEARSMPATAAVLGEVYSIAFRDDGSGALAWFSGDRVEYAFVRGSTA